ncbi:hypothetical protein ACFSF0_07695 [Ottowia flava]|uniref:Uncharacterized protein n=1 Tax=Ottowia flava TaxID=2675430 RepID=A0ABW4KVW9_9BURK|nr:hypothetical protein [Ottowia sp. GY511]
MTSPSAPATQDKRQRLNLLKIPPNQIAARAPALVGRDLIAQAAAAVKARSL